VTVGATQARVVALVPAWKASPFIVATLNALAAQTYANLEILVSDDASPDDTAALCERFAAGDARFRVIRRPHNLGWIGNVNALLREARGDYFVFAFHDDLLEPSYIERCVAALEADPRAILAFTDIAMVYEDGTREDQSYPLLDGVADRLQRARLVARMQGSWWIPNRGVFRASAAKAIGGLRRHLAGEFSADWPWLLHMTLLGEFVRIPERLCTKVLQPGSLSRSRSWGSRDTILYGAVALSAMRAVSRAEIPVREKFVLQGTLAAFVWRKLWRRTLGRWLRGLGPRKWASE
jgi:glycosyltransferase involved in cell wall biosynthesis